MATQPEITKITERIAENLDNPEWLSKAVVYLATRLYYQNSLMAVAELNEKQATMAYLDKVDANGKKMSVAEADKRGVIDTQNQYGEQKAQNEAIVELINSIKHRLTVLGWERRTNEGR